jgi:hypothetical protein
MFAVKESATGAAVEYRDGAQGECVFDAYKVI